MAPNDEEQDLTSQASRRRRALAGVLAGAAIAIPGVALATSGGGGGSDAVTPVPSSDDTPSLSIQDDGDRRRHDGRDCPKKDRDGGGSDTTSEQRDL